MESSYEQLIIDEIGKQLNRKEKFSLSEVIINCNIVPLSYFEQSKIIKLAVKKYKIVTSYKNKEFIISKNNHFDEKEASESTTAKNVAIIFGVAVSIIYVLRLIIKLFIKN